MGSLIFASCITLTLLSSFVFCLIMLALLFTEAIHLELAIALTITANLIFWLIGPAITDLINRWFYKVRFLRKEEVEKLYPEIYRLIREISEKYKFPFPKIGLIPDNNPTAFTYGSARFNSRIVLTDGIFHFLNTDEARAVVAHELGHIVNRDFIVMMVASTLIQILYEIYAFLIRARGKRAAAAKLIALLSYILYIIGIYLLYFLSRTREYLADEFSAKFTEPKDLANALIKIAYGIVAVEDSDASKRLLQSTRPLGIIDVKNAKHIGVISYITNSNPEALSEVMVFDKVSPWAKIAELSSTHPLTGNRIGRLSELSKSRGQSFSFDVGAAIKRLKIDRLKLYGNFLFGILIYFLPWLCALASLLALPITLVPTAFAVGLLLQIPYRFPIGTFKPTTILDEMRNPYASLIQGKPVVLSGKVIGRGEPGYVFGEDMMYQDLSGMIFLDYTSLFGFLGNLFFALKKLKTLLGLPSQATGWFYRGMGSMVALKNIKTEGETVKSHPVLWALLLPFFLLALSGFLHFAVPASATEANNYAIDFNVNDSIAISHPQIPSTAYASVVFKLDPANFFAQPNNLLQSKKELLPKPYILNWRKFGAASTTDFVLEITKNGKRQSFYQYVKWWALSLDKKFLFLANYKKLPDEQWELSKKIIDIEKGKETLLPGNFDCVSTRAYWNGNNLITYSDQNDRPEDETRFGIWTSNGKLLYRVGIKGIRWDDFSTLALHDQVGLLPKDPNILLVYSASVFNQDTKSYLLMLDLNQPEKNRLFYITEGFSGGYSMPVSWDLKDTTFESKEVVFKENYPH